MGSEDIVSQNTADVPLTTRVQDTFNLGYGHKSLKYHKIWSWNLLEVGGSGQLSQMYEQLWLNTWLSMYQKEREQDDVFPQNITFRMYINIRVVSVFVVTKGVKIASFCGHSWGDKKSRQIKVKC